MEEDALSHRLADLLGFLYGAPIALTGLIWLVAVTDLALLRQRWPLLLLLLGVATLLRRWSFSIFVEVGPATSADWRESLEVIISWSAALLFGPTALWVTFLGVISSLIERWMRPASSTMVRWRYIRNFVLDVGQVTAGLVALALYERWGGIYPPTDFTWGSLAPIVYATLIRFALYRLCWLPLFAYWIRALQAREAGYSFKRYIAIVMALPALFDPFAILVAAVYTLAGLGPYLFFIAGLILVSLLGHQLSKTAVRSRQHARELEKLEQLGRAIIRTPVDPKRLGQVLAEHIPAMFPDFQIEVRLFPDQVIYRRPEAHTVSLEQAWEWLRTLDAARCFLPGETPPWARERLLQGAVALAPIFEPDGDEPIGGIAGFQSVHSLWSTFGLANSLPAIQTLARQIGSALQGAQRYRMEQELALAGQIQASFLPDQLPEIPGWQTAAILRPARQTAGDFYDLIPLPNGRFGILTADVADKGMGAALYMALSRTLLRTYAVEYHTRPDFVMKVVNRRLLEDTDVTMFVTVFYAVIDPLTNEAIYCNAGHNPPYLLQSDGDDEPQRLTKTGMALGVLLGQTWEQHVIQIAPGATLALYTDGVIDAQNEAGAFFGEERLEEILRANAGRPAHNIQAALIGAIERFTGDAPQFDDITLMIVTLNDK